MIVERKVIILILCVSVFLCFGFSVHALEINYPRMPGMDETPEQCIELPPEEKLGCFIKYVYHFSITIAGFACFIAIISGGVLHLISAGAIGKVKEARERMLGGMLGIILLLSSYLILYFLNPSLLILSMVAPEPVEPVMPEIPPYESEVPVYIEIPLGRLIERVKIISDIANYWSYQAWYEGAEDSISDHASLREFTDCLKRLTDECDCADIDTTNCPPPPGQCIGDPCDKPRATDCADIDLPANLREAIEALKPKIEIKEIEFADIRTSVENARAALDVATARLELAEALIRDARAFIWNYDSFIAIEDKEIKKIWGAEDTPVITEYAPPEDWPPGDPDDPDPPPPSGDWQWPIHDNTVLSSNATDHRINPRCSVCAWDFTAPCGTSIYPVKDGKVTYFRNSNCNVTTDIDDRYGCWVIVQHSGGWKTYYCHMQEGSIQVSIGQHVTQDTILGKVGCTGLTSFGPHVHFEVFGPTADSSCKREPGCRNAGALDGRTDPAKIFDSPTYKPFCKNYACPGCGDPSSCF